jgi:hypothetical protein
MTRFTAAGMVKGVMGEPAFAGLRRGKQLASTAYEIGATRRSRSAPVNNSLTSLGEKLGAQSASQLIARNTAVFYNRTR